MNNVIHVDEDDNEIDIVTRDVSHHDGLLHRIAVVYLYDKSGNILIQKRKDGRLDHSSAGHVDPGETYEQTAKRELEEELGVKDAALVKIGKAVSEEHNTPGGIFVRHVFEVFETEGDAGVLQEEEVEKVFWDDPLAVLEKMKDDPEGKIYSGGFQASLPVYLAHHKG